MEFDRAQFWKPNSNDQVRKGIIENTIESEEDATYYIHNENQQYSLAHQRQKLPIFQYKREILYLIETYSVVVIVGQTGSGKSTQIPQYLYEAGWAEGGRVVTCTQPRAIAAQQLAQRVAEEQHCDLGERVGYSVRFDNKCHNELTRIKYVTDGMYVRKYFYKNNKTPNQNRAITGY